MAGPRRDDVDVVYDAEATRFVARSDGEPSGAFLDVVDRDDHWALIHTEVPDALGGRGIGSALVRAALERARAEGIVVNPRCSFVAAWLRRHPDQQDLVHPRFRARLERAGGEA